MLKMLNKREKVVLWLTAAVIAFSFIFNFFIAPVFTKSDNLNKEIRLSQRKIARSLRLLRHKDDIKNKYAKFLPPDSLVERPEEASISALSALERLAKEAGIRVIEIRPEADKKVNLYKEALINLRAEGNIEGYLKFIYDIERSPLLFKIKKFQLAVKPNVQALESVFSISQLLVLE